MRLARVLPGTPSFPSPTLNSLKDFLPHLLPSKFCHVGVPSSLTSYAGVHCSSTQRGLLETSSGAVSTQSAEQSYACLAWGTGSATEQMHSIYMKYEQMKPQDPEPLLGSFELSFLIY